MSRFMPPTQKEKRRIKKSFMPQAIFKVTGGQKSRLIELTILERIKVELECEKIIRVLRF